MSEQFQPSRTQSPSRSKPRSGRGLSLLFVALMGAGAGLLVATYLNTPTTPRATAQGPDDQEPPGGTWMDYAPTREILESRLQPLVGGSELAHRTEELQGRLTDFRAPATSLSLSVRRSLAGGDLFASHVEVDYAPGSAEASAPQPPAQSPTAQVSTIQLTIRRLQGEPQAYRVLLWDGEIARFERSAAGGSDAGSVDLGPSMPLALGDLRVEDAAALLQCLQRDRLEPLGQLAGEGSQAQLVFACSFAAVQTLSGAPDATSPGDRGASALVYLTAEDLLPRSVRVFDAAGRLVRLYGSPLYRHGSLRGLTAISLPSRSQTLLEIETPG